MNNITLESIAEKIAASQKIALLTHKNPDGDTLGSALALKKAVMSMFPDKSVTIFCAHKVPKHLAFLFRGESEPSTEVAEPDFDLVVSVDTATTKLMGDLEQVFGGITDIKIDHHATGDDFAKFGYTDETKGACAEIIFELVKIMGADVSVCADELYTGIATDTGCFRYSNASPATLRTAALLLEAGAKREELNRRLFESRSIGATRAIAAAYENMVFSDDGKVAAVLVTNEMKQKYGICDEDLAEINSLPREIEGVYLGVTIKQNSEKPEKFKISARSVSPVCANRMCANFGGGGHIRAAGGEIISSDADDILSSVMRAAEEELRLSESEA